MEFIWSAIIGFAAGLIAALVMKRKGTDFIINLLAGTSGSLLGGWILSQMTVNSGMFYKHMLMSLLGAVVFLWIISFCRKKKSNN
jgi:uncharacterized membrane protein YeaQ/YmgE (transglycosylase-associated protein family)